MDSKLLCGKAKPFDVTMMAIMCDHDQGVCAHQKYCPDEGHMVNSDQAKQCPQFKEPDPSKVVVCPDCGVTMYIEVNGSKLCYRCKTVMQVGGGEEDASKANESV